VRHLSFSTWRLAHYSPFHRLKFERLAHLIGKVLTILFSHKTCCSFSSCALRTCYISVQLLR
jgi:hypothetical protein